MFNIQELADAARMQLKSLGEALLAERPEAAALVDPANADEIAMHIGALFCATFHSMSYEPPEIEQLYHDVVDPVIDHFIELASAVHDAPVVLQ